MELMGPPLPSPLLLLSPLLSSPFTSPFLSSPSLLSSLLSSVYRSSPRANLSHGCLFACEGESSLSGSMVY